MAGRQQRAAVDDRAGDGAGVHGDAGIGRDRPGIADIAGEARDTDGLVGGGPAASVIRDLAAQLNSRAGRRDRARIDDAAAERRDGNDNDAATGRSRNRSGVGDAAGEGPHPSITAGAGVAIAIGTDTDACAAGGYGPAVDDAAAGAGGAKYRRHS